MKASKLIEALEEGYVLGNKLPEHGWVWFWQDEDGLHKGNAESLFSRKDFLANVFHDPESWYVGEVTDGVFKRKQKTMTVRDLMAILVKCNPDDAVIASSDPEGNGYARVWTVAEVNWVPSWAEICDEEHEELPEGAESVVCIWPG